MTPNRNGKFVRQTLEEAIDIAADVLACSDMYCHPAPPPRPGDTASKSSGCSSESDESRCNCCSFSTKNKTHRSPDPEVVSMFVQVLDKHLKNKE